MRWYKLDEKPSESLPHPGTRTAQKGETAAEHESKVQVPLENFFWCGPEPEPVFVNRRAQETVAAAAAVQQEQCEAAAQEVVTVDVGQDTGMTALLNLNAYGESSRDSNGPT